MAVNYGFLEFDGGVYRFASMLSQGPQCQHIPDKQREVLLKLMEAFPTERFSARDAAIQIGMKPCSIGYYLDSFTQRGILKMTKARQNTNCYEWKYPLSSLTMIRDVVIADLASTELLMRMRS